MVSYRVKLLFLNLWVKQRNHAALIVLGINKLAVAVSDKVVKEAMRKHFAWI